MAAATIQRVFMTRGEHAGPRFVAAPPGSRGFAASVGRGSGLRARPW